MSIDEILEEMEALLDKSMTVPLAGHKKIIDGERMRELINDIRLNMPHELKEAKKIEYDCQRILNEAKINAEAIIRKAEERAAQICSREAVVEEAKKKPLIFLQRLRLPQKICRLPPHFQLQKCSTKPKPAYNKNLMDIKRTKEKVAATLKASPAFNQDANQNK